MGVILDSPNYFIDTVLDMIIIFVLGGALIVLYYIMVKYPDQFMKIFVSYITILLMIMLTYINRYCTNNTEHKNKLKIINFFSIYTICLNIMLFIVVNFQLHRSSTSTTSTSYADTSYPDTSYLEAS